MRGRGRARVLGTLASSWTPARWTIDDAVEGITAADVLTSAGLITTFMGQLGIQDATQASAAYQAEFVSSHAPLGGKPAARFTSDYYVWTGVAYASTSWALAMVYDDETVGDAAYSIDFSGGRALHAPNDGGGNNAYFDGVTMLTMATSTTDPASEMLILNGASADLYRNGVAQNTGVACTARQLGGTVAVGSNYSGAPASMLLNCYIAELWVLKHADDRDAWFDYTNRRYGT